MSTLWKCIGYFNGILSPFANATGKELEVEHKLCLALSSSHLPRPPLHLLWYSTLSLYLLSLFLCEKEWTCFRLRDGWVRRKNTTHHNQMDRSCTGKAWPAVQFMKIELFLRRLDYLKNWFSNWHQVVVLLSYALQLRKKKTQVMTIRNWSTAISIVLLVGLGLGSW